MNYNRKLPAYDPYPWTSQDINKRVGTAPRPEKYENINVPSRVPTSSSKYTEFQNQKISIKGTGWKSYKTSEPVRTISSHQVDILKIKDPRPTTNGFKNTSPLPEEHVWEEGNKRPKTQNEKFRRKNSANETGNDISDAFPSRNIAIGGQLYDVPIIVVREDKGQRVASAKKNNKSKTSQRPSTFKPGKSSLITSLDQEFLDLFQM